MKIFESKEDFEVIALLLWGMAACSSLVAGGTATNAVVNANYIVDKFGTRYAPKDTVKKKERT